MMFPLGDDVEVNTDTDWPKKKRCMCKILGAALIVFLFYGFLFLMTESDTTAAKTESGPEKEPPAKPPICEIKLGDKEKEEIRSMIQKEIQSSNKHCSKVSRINPEQMRSLIKDEIKKQQKVTIKPDFASASAGGMVLWASPTWTEGYSYIYFLFVPIRSTAPSPSILLEPTRQPGDCWPMSGRHGSVVIQLAARANIVGFTMEHIDPAMSLSGGTPEAPNRFSVYGLSSEADRHETKHLFGTYTYDNKRDEESQYFRVQNVNRKSFMYIELEILSNHGNEKYTCLYRFQVHGFIDRAYHCHGG